MILFFLLLRFLCWMVPTKYSECERTKVSGCVCCGKFTERKWVTSRLPYSFKGTLNFFYVKWRILHWFSSMNKWFARTWTASKLTWVRFGQIWSKCLALLMHISFSNHMPTKPAQTNPASCLIHLFFLAMPYRQRHGPKTLGQTEALLVAGLWCGRLHNLTRPP